MKLFDEIGEEKIKQVVRSFYDRAIHDPMIGYFFTNKDHEHLIEQQTAFTIGLLGGPRRYKGRPILSVHQPLGIRAGHFGRRQIILEEILVESGISEPLRKQWLALENQLKSMILGVSACDT